MRVLERALVYCTAPLQEIAFRSRSWLKLRRGPPVLVGDADPEQGRELCARYDLAAYRSRARADLWRDALWRLGALESLVGDLLPPPGETMHAIDVGCQSWSYVEPLAHFLAAWGKGRALALDGYEIDAHALLPDLRSRADWAQAWCADVTRAKVRYVPRDFLACETEGVDVVTLFFPFVTRYALLRWGLPLSCFKPKALLAHALARLGAGGLLVSCHQTGDEARRARALLATEPEAEFVREVALAPALAPDPDAAADRVGLVFRSRRSSARRS